MNPRARSLALLSALLLALATVGMAGGTTGRAQDVPSDEELEAPPAEGPPAAGGPTFASGAVSVSEIESALATARIDNFRTVGTSSVTFQLQLTGPIDGAFKPETESHRRGWLNEVAAYRIASHLGMDSVPPCIVRIVDRGQFLRRLDPSYEGDWDALVARIVFVSGTVRGSVSYWIPNLARTGDLDQPAGLLRWTSWLEIGSEVPPESVALARDLSTMAVFDLLIGNPDRASGGNMRTIENAEVRLAIRDHNLAFAAHPAAAQLERMVTMMRRAHRFPRSFVERLVSLDEAALRRVVSDETVGPLLDDAQIAGVLQRRETALSWIGSLIEQHGEGAVLSFE